MGFAQYICGRYGLGDERRADGGAGSAGRGRAYTVALNTAPSGPVTVSGANGDTSAVTVASTALTYSATTWNTAQTMTTGWTRRRRCRTRRRGARGRAGLYVAALGGRDGAGTDNDPPGLAVEPTTLMLTEQDASAGSGTYTVLFTAVSVTVLVVALAAK